MARFARTAVSVTIAAALSSLSSLSAIPLQAQASQGTKTFKTRLSVVAIDVTMQATVAGTGSVTAVLTGTKLAVNGTYEGLRSPVTTVQIHKGQTGVRGPVVPGLDLKASGGTSGTITGALDLTPTLAADLAKGWLYVQLQSEKAPDGNLWGWLLPQENKR